MWEAVCGKSARTVKRGVSNPLTKKRGENLHMNYVVAVVAVYIFFNSLIVLPIKYIKDIKYGQALPLIFISSVLILYLSGIIFKSFYIGFYLLVLLSFIGLITLILNIKNKEFINRYLTNGFYLFIIILIVLAIYNYKRCFNIYDEFSHWGPFIKSMYQNNNFYCFDDVYIFHKEYPPFFSLFELLWCYITSSYDEAIITLSIHVFEVATLFTFYIDTYNKEFKKTLFLMIISALIMITLDYEENTLGSIYTDYPMMLYYVYLFLLTLKVKDNKYSFILLVLSLSMFLLTKQISIALYLVILFLFICLYFNKTKEFFIKLSSIIIFPLLTYKSWSLVIRDIEVIKQFDISINDVLSLSNGLSDIQASTSSNYLSALIKTGLTNGPLKLPYVLLCVIVLILLILFIKDNIRTKASIISSIIVSFVGYALLMYVMYMFCFSENEMNRLASYTRYMGSFVTASLIITLLLIEFEYKYLVIFSLLTIITIKPSNCLLKTPYFRLFLPSSKIYKDCANTVKTHNNILVVSNDSGYGREILNFYLEDNFDYTYSNELIDYEGYDYIYFINYNDLNGLYKVNGNQYIKLK